MLKKIPLGNTGLLVSRVGLGTVKFGRSQGLKYPSTFIIPDDREVKNLLQLAEDWGINLVDTAPAYGNAEERLGNLLQLQQKREKWVIVTKVGEEFIQSESSYNFTPEHTRFSIERSLKRLKTDVLDVVLVHSDGNDVYNIQHFGILDILGSLKQEGKIRAFGMSSKTVEGGLLTLKQADLAMITYNPLQTQEKPVIQYAQENQKGILIKKALASGHVSKLPGADPIQQTFEFIFQEKGVSSIILGTINPEHLKQAVDFFNH